jgi:hypothetical protein
MLSMNNVLLVPRYSANRRLIFPEVASELRRRGLRTRLVHDKPPTLKHRVWTLGFPTHVVSPFRLDSFRPEWATVWAQARFDKSVELRILEAAGVSVPRWVLMKAGDVPDLSDFSEVVVTKPILGHKGAIVRMMRRDRVKHRGLAGDTTHVCNEGLLVQEYIHTGPWPISFRVGTVFGEPVYALRIEANRNRDPIVPGATLEPSAFAGKTIVASSKGCTMSLQVPEDVVALGQRIHRAFPDIPLLGTDIVRDQETGRLYALEVNSRGGTLHLASEQYERMKREFGFDLRKQFGGAQAVARGIYQRLTDPAWGDGQPRPPHRI